jgi:hypothetical protein
MSATAIILLCVLMCPIVMGLMMLFMRQGHGGSRETRHDEDGRAE